MALGDYRDGGRDGKMNTTELQGDGKTANSTMLYYIGFLIREATELVF